jgi:hypothetical protein
MGIRNISIKHKYLICINSYDDLGKTFIGQSRFNISVNCEMIIKYYIVVNQMLLSS